MPFPWDFYTTFVLRNLVTILDYKVAYVDYDCLIILCCCSIQFLVKRYLVS